MAQWMGKVGFELQPLADYVLEKIKQGGRIFADETTARRKRPGCGPMHSTVGHLAASVHRGSLIALRAVAA